MHNPCFYHKVVPLGLNACDEGPDVFEWTLTDKPGTLGDER